MLREADRLLLVNCKGKVFFQVDVMEEDANPKSEKDMMRSLAMKIASADDPEEENVSPTLCREWNTSSNTEQNLILAHFVIIAHRYIFQSSQRKTFAKTTYDCDDLAQMKACGLSFP